jgi:hypothetical protein
MVIFGPKARIQKKTPLSALVVARFMKYQG